MSVNSILYPMDMVRERELNVPIFQKQNLTIEEATVYSNIGQHKLRELTADERCPFVLWVGNKRLIKRRQFDDHSYKKRPLRKGFFPLSKGKSTNCNLSFSFFIFISICSSFYS